MQKILCLCLWQVIVLSIATVSTLSISIPAVAQGVGAEQEGGIRMRGPKSSDVFPYDRYGPITKRDTLWKIALTVRPDNRLTVYQVMQALYQANPQAFAENNLNYLVEGQYLKIPSFNEMMAVNRGEAEKKSNQDEKSWQKKQPKTTPKAVRKPKEPSVNKKDLDTVKVEINDQLQKIDTQQQQRLKSIQNDVLDSIDGLQAILKENEKLRQRLSSFNSQLGTMQKEVAKGKEIKLQMDSMLKLQQALLEKAQAREKELLLEKQQAEAEKNNIFSSLWFIILMGTVPALLILIVAALILKRQKTEQPPKEKSAKKGKKAKAVKDNEKDSLDEIDELSLDDDLSLEDELSLDGDLSLDDELEIEDDLSVDLLEEDDVIHLDSDDDELDGLDDLEDILLDDDSQSEEQSSEGLAQGDLDDLLSSNELSIDEEPSPEDSLPVEEAPIVDDTSESDDATLEDNQLDQGDLDDLLNGLDEELSIDEEPSADDEINIDDVVESSDPDELLNEASLDEDLSADDKTIQTEITDPDDIDALLESMNVEAPSAKEEPPVEDAADAQTEITDPDDIDALLESMNVEAPPAKEEPPVEDAADAQTEITDPDDIDALLESMNVEAPSAKEEPPIEDAADAQTEITDPNDIDALLESMGVEEPQKEITDPKDIEDLLESMGDEAHTDDIASNEDESPNKAKIDSLSEEYVAPLLAVDFSDIHGDNSEGDNSEDDEPKDVNNVDDDLDIDALIAEAEESKREKSPEALDIGDELEDGEQGAFDEDTLAELLNDSVVENAVELTPDFSDQNVLADLLNDGSDDGEGAVSEATEIEDIQELDNLEFDELLANIEEESNVASNAVDYNQNQDLDSPISLDDFDDPNSGVATSSDTSSHDENYVSVDSLLSATQDIDATDELYNEANIDVGLGEYPEFTENVNQVDVDDDKDGMAAKLDLAKVYVEIGDQDNAQVILQEIISLGNPQQQLEAQEILNNL